MKIRLNYVSNSSSSSFIIKGTKIGDFDDVKNFDELKVEDGHELYVIGSHLVEGYDLFKLTRQYFDFLKEIDYRFSKDSSSDYYSGDILEVSDFNEASFYPDEDIVVNGDEYTISRDYKHSWDLARLASNYADSAVSQCEERLREEMRKDDEYFSDAQQSLWSEYDGDEDCVVTCD